MIDESSKKTKLSWPKTLMKLFSIKAKSTDDYIEDGLGYECGDQEWRNNFQEEAPTIKKSNRERNSKGNSDCYQRKSKIEFDSPQVTDVHNYRIFVATWNVGGKSPASSLNLEDWLHTSPPADIYVLGFQEIVPLNAGNVLGAEDNGPARKWLELIGNTLNSLPQTTSPVFDPTVEIDVDFEGSMAHKPSSLFSSRSFRSMRMMESDMAMLQPRLDRRFSVCDRVMFRDPLGKWSCSSDEDTGSGYSPDSNNYSPISCVENSKYSLVASKQMVGVFLTIWVKNDLRDDVRNIKVSCVGRGLMGYLGNKGSISISMALHQTSFCFVCSHLTSGQKDGDELRRNSDVMEILKRTRFPRFNGTEDQNSPRTILEHDRIIWLGDLNYRIALSYRCAKALVEMQNWRVLLANDQLRIEQRQGRVFEGWKEGKIHFPPTYKYSNNSDRYACDEIHPKEKRRTPAWCDRILWNGKGLHQMCYVRGESRFSDHRPVYSVFLAEVESLRHDRSKKSVNCLSSRVEVEELLPYPYIYGSHDFY